MTNVDNLYEQTEGGATLFKIYFPNFDSGKRVNLVALRDDDSHPSCSIFQDNGRWLIKDHGGADNKTKNMINFVMDHEGLDFKDAVAHIENICGITSDNENVNNRSGVKMSKVAPVKERQLIKRASGKFTEKELLYLGAADRNGSPCITQDVCDQFSLIPLDGYINKSKDGAFSWKVEAADDYPIMYYDYGTWGKIYQPMNKIRFMYWGDKPKGYLFGCNIFRKAYEDATERDVFPHAVEPKSKKNKQQDDYVDDEKDERWEALTICSGPSDALNVYKAGHIVCWPNSESEPLSQAVIRTLFKLTRNLYVLYDADETGLRNAYNLAIRNLDVQVINLPEDLRNYSTGKRDEDGKLKMCKDIKDYMMFYKRGQIDPYKEFKYRLVKLAKPLKFWMETENPDGTKKTELSNAHLYRFLSACGFHKMPTAIGRAMSNENEDEWKFVYVKDNVVEVIQESSIVARVKEFMVRFIMENTEYYSTVLENIIYRTRQINIEQLKNLETITPNFDAYSQDCEYYFFKNAIVRVTSDEIVTVKPSECPYYTLKHKIINHEINLIQPLFAVNKTNDFNYAIDLLNKTTRDTAEYNTILKEIDRLTDECKQWSLQINTDFDYIRFLYNSGNKFWREEREAEINGSTFPDNMRHAVEKNFINKLTTIGYMLCKYKSRGLPKAVYCMETSVLEEDEGSHNGGTGKSLFMSTFNMMRKAEFLNGQAMKDNKWDFVYQRINFDTDIVSIDDLNSSIDMNRFLPDVTGDLQVNPKNKSDFVIPYDRSPKFVFTCNHAIKRFNPSLRRRIQFVSFSDYYHSSKPDEGIHEHSPRTEFGRDLIRDYDHKDMNIFYNLMLQCVLAYKQLGLVDPDMPDIETRQKRAAIGLVFIDWADQYFTGKFNIDVDRRESFMKLNDYCRDLHTKNSITLNTFSKKMKQWCEIRGYTMNPQWWIAGLSKTDQEKNVKRKLDDLTKEVHEYFFIENKEQQDISAMENEPF